MNTSMMKTSMLLDDLYKQKMMKLQEQKVLSDQMNSYLTKKGGLNDASCLKKRNLTAAIAVSNQSGCKFIPSYKITIIERF